jgi:hypothetical protein
MLASTSLGILHVQVETFACRFGTPTGVWCDFRVICEVAALSSGRSMTSTGCAIPI